jgi:hypothetical protein
VALVKAREAGLEVRDDMWASHVGGREQEGGGVY